MNNRVPHMSRTDDPYVELIDTDIERAFSQLHIELIKWGESARGERSVLGFPSRNQIYRMMGIGISSTRRGPLRLSDHYMDLDRLVAQLSDESKRALYVQYVIGGSAKHKAKTVQMTVRACYRKLKKAHQQLLGLQTEIESREEDVEVLTEQLNRLQKRGDKWRRENK